MGINLTKGQKIDLTKDSGESLTSFCVGVNWGMIKEKGLFRSKKIAVDLDASCVLFNENNEVFDVVYYGQLASKDGAILHSGDDLTGDAEGDDGLDNEIISVDLQKISPEVDKIIFFINSYKRQDFATIPFASIRLYEGTPDCVNHIYATYDIAAETVFKGHVSMVLGKLYRRNAQWRFGAIGEPTKDQTLKDTVETIWRNYL